MTLAPLDLQRDAHRRLNALTGEWVLVSPHRSARPWQGQVEPLATPAARAHDPDCYLCPGNRRADGSDNPPYLSTFVFDNDFPALLPQGSTLESGAGTLLHAQGEIGRCRVICYSPQHDLTLGQMPLAGIREVIDTWATETAVLGAEPGISAVTIFENRGAMMGASNPHPHGQIWSNSRVPDELLRECGTQRAYHARGAACLLCDYLALELGVGERIVAVNDACVALVPFWAVWPFETLVLPRHHAGTLGGLDAHARNGFAHVLKDLTRRYDALFGIVFPYTMGLHQQPTDGGAHPGWHLHAHFYPPLLRSATVRKFMVGYELLAGPQRDITPEAAAARLRAAATA
jgi:UDPglucose--hexose-1-phosphate uridylyltransferase